MSSTHEQSHEPDAALAQPRSRRDPLSGTGTTVTRRATPTRTVVIAYGDPTRKVLASWDHHQEASAGEILLELPPPFQPGYPCQRD